MSRKLSVPVEAVTDEVTRKHIDIRKEETPLVTKPEKGRKQLLEERLLINAISKNPKILFSNEIIKLFSTPFVKKILNELKAFLSSSKEKNNFNLNLFGSSLPKELQNGFSEIVLENSDLEDIDTLIKELMVLNLRHKLEELGVKIRESEDNQNYLEEFNELTKKLSTL